MIFVGRVGLACGIRAEPASVELYEFIFLMLVYCDLGFSRCDRMDVRIRMRSHADIQDRSDQPNKLPQYNVEERWIVTDLFSAIIT